MKEVAYRVRGPQRNRFHIPRGRHGTEDRMDEKPDVNNFTMVEI
jgi:hypothetical protein